MTAALPKLAPPNSACLSLEELQSQAFALPLDVRRGRGAGVNPASRYDLAREHIDDGWQQDGLDLPPFKTEVVAEQARRLITKNNSPDIGFERSINPYRGCEHGCIYCYARPSHAYLGHSPGLDFETKLTVKPNAATALKRELSAPSYEPKVIALGTNTDPYQPIEREWQLTRQILQLFAETRHPVSITTKSTLILRDTDLLSDLAKHGLVRVLISITTLDRKTSRSMEPRAATPMRRLDVVRALNAAGVPTGILMAPVIPALTDHEVESLLAASAAAGAASADYILLRLPKEVSPLFRDWLLREHPNHYQRVMSLLKSMRGGRDYEASFGKRFRGTGPYASLLESRFSLACRRLGLKRRSLKLPKHFFKPPGAASEQLSLL